MGELFGTDGIRGVANHWPLVPEFVVRLGQALGVLLRERTSRPRVLIGRDTRLSGEMLAHALSAGLMARGVDVLSLGVIPTPGVAYLTRHLEADAGVVISASHNPYQDNGIKVFGPDGFKLSDELEERIEAMVLGNGTGPAMKGSELGRVLDREHGDVGRAYVAFLERSAGAGLLKGFHVVLDCADGATSAWAPALFRRLGARVTALHAEPDGVNINESYEYLTPSTLARVVRALEAQAGVAFDGDGDRVVMVDEQGEFIDGDHILTILGRAMQAEGRLTGATVVGTVMANMGVEVALREVGVRLERTRVGDRYVTQRMLEGGFTLGGEQAGHVIFLDEGHTAGDGMYTAIRVFRVMVASGQPLSELRRYLQKYPQVLINVEVPHKPPLEELSEVQEAIERARGALGDHGRVLVRYSGTQPLARVMLEGSDQAEIERWGELIANAIRRAVE